MLVAAVAVGCVLVAQRSHSGTREELLHVGALTAQMDAQDGLYAEGGTDDYSMPTRRGMFTERAARKAVVKVNKGSKVQGRHRAARSSNTE